MGSIFVKFYGYGDTRAEAVQDLMKNMESSCTLITLYPQGKKDIPYVSYQYRDVNYSTPISIKTCNEKYWAYVY